MKGRLTINNSVCGRWLLSLFTMLLMSVGMQAEEYDLWVAGTQVTSDNASNVLSDGKVSWNNSSKILTLNGATINGTIVSNVTSAITIHLVGTNTITTTANQMPIQSSLSNAQDLTFTAAEGAMLLTNKTRTNGNVDICSGFNFSSESDIPSGYAFSWDANEYCNLGKYYNLYLKSLEFQWLGAQYVTAANCANLLQDQSSAHTMVYYDATENVLTLDNANVNFSANESGGACYFINTVSGNNNLKVNLVGSNSLNADVEVGLAWGDNLTFTTNTANPGMLTVWRSSTSTPFIDGTGTTYANGLGYSYIEELNKHVIDTNSESYDLTVAGVHVNSENANNITGTNITAGTVSFNNNTKTLTLTNATINGSIEKIANEEGDQLIINLVGTNTVNGQILFQSPDLMYPGDLSFTGTGSLNITSNDDVFYGVSSVNTGEGLYIATDSPDPQCSNGYYFASNSGDTTIKDVTVSTSVTYPIWVYNTSTTHYTQLTAAASTFTTPTANVDENHSGSVSFSNNTLTLTNFLCKTTENSEFVFFVGKSLDNLTVNLVGESSIYYNGFHYSQGEEDDEPTLTYTTSSNGRLTYTSEPSYWSYYVTVNYENGLGYYSSVISTDWPRLLIGTTQVTGTGNPIEGVSFNATTNTLTLNGVTIGTQNSTVTDIIVYIKDLNVEISGTNTVYGRFYGFYEENGSRAGTITFKKKTGVETANLTVSGFGEGGPVTNFVSSTLEEGLFISGIDTDNEHVSSLSYHDGDYYDSEHSDNIVKKVLITSSEPIPLWVNGVQVNCDNATNVLGDEMKSVSYDATNQILTLRGANFDTNNPSAIVVGEEISALTLHLIGNSCIYSNEGPIISFANESSSLIVTTSEKLPGSLSATNLSTVETTLQNGLTYENGKISASLANAVEAQFTGKSTYVYTENAVDNSYIYSSPEYYSSYATGENGGAFVKVSTRGQATTATMWPSSLSNAELQQRVILQLGALTATSNVMVQVKGITNGTADGKTYSNAIALSTADADGIIEIPLTSTVTSENLQLVFSSSSSFSFMPISIAFSTSSPSSSGYGIQIGQVDVTEDNASNITGEGITGTISYDDANHILTLNGATITPQEEGVGISYSGTTDLTIKLIGTNAINSGNCSAIRGGQTPKLIFTKAGEQPASLQMETTESSVIDGFSAVNHEGLFKIDERILGVDNTPDTYTVLVSSTLLSGGSGTPGDPLLIKTKEDLTNFAYYICNNKISRNVSVKLYNDLNCAGLTHFAPIGYNNLAFEGTFYGNDKTISNLSIENAGLGTVGLFSYLPEGASVERLTLDNCTISGGNSSNNNIGGLVGTLSGGTISNCIIKNSSISCKNDTQSPTVGGLVGELSSGSITNSTVQACTVNAVTQDTGNSGPVAYAGGIVGNAAGGTITGCQVKGETTMLADYGTYSASVVAGAIVARKGTVTLSNNTYEYTVTASTNKYNGTSTELTTKSGYTQRAIGGQTYNEQTQQYEDNPDIFTNNGAVMYTKSVALPVESAQATVMGEEGTYYSTDVVSDAVVLNVAPGQTATLNAIPGDGLAIASLTATNTTSSETITTTSTMIEAGTMQYTFTMPDAPVTVAVTTTTSYGVTVAGVAVTEQNHSNVLGDGKVSFDVESSTLTLNGATINGGICCSLDGALTVHLVGQNVIDGGYVDANNNGERAFVGELQTTKLTITTDAENPGQLLLKRPYVNQYQNAEYYSDYMYPSFKNGLVESKNNNDKKVLIAQGPVVTPGDGLYWPTQQYTITDGAQISCSNSQGQSVDVSVNANSFTLTKTGKYHISISKAVTVDDTNFSLSNSGLYIVHNKPGFSKEAGSYTGAQTITLTNLPENIPEGAGVYPQVWYYLGENVKDSVRVYSAEQEIAVSESTKVCVYFLDEDTGKVAKSVAVEAEYTIRQDPNLHFGPVNDSYFDNGSKQYANFGQDFDAPVVKKVDSEYQPSTDLTGLTITYSSSDENVATIDATGKLTIVGGGKTTITAQSAQTDVYAPSTAWYQLEVKPSVPQYSLEKGVYYTGEKVALMPTVDNGKTYYRIGSDGDFTEYTNSITLPKGTNKIVSYTVCGEGTNAVSSYEREVYYFVYDELTFSPVSGTTFNGTQDITITNVPTDDKVSVAVYYKLDDGDPVQYTDKITLTESARVSAYIEVTESDTYVSEPIEAEYTIRQDPALRFYTSENSYMSTGSTENISYDDEYTSPVLKGKINGEYTNELTALGITYSSSDETVATIDQTGKITIVGGGYATITATSQQTDIYSASTTNFILKVRPADPNVSLEEGAYYTGKKLTMVRIGENGTMYYSYGYKDESERTVYPEGGISLPKGCYDFYPYTRCGTNEQNIWSYGNAHRMMYVYDQPTISKDAGTYDGEIEVEITNLPESGSYNADVYYYFDDDEDHAVQYTSGSKITVNESKTLNVYIYVEGDSSKNYKTDVIKRQYVIRQDAGLAYTQNNEPVEVAEYTIGGENNEDLPELVNENGVAVTYSSEDENVATVNAQGKVTIVGIGETTIMATSAQTATLMAGEAAYTLRVYKDLNYESITVTVADATYTGEAVEPEVTVKDGTTDITELMIISYDNNVEVGDQASVTIVPNDDLEVNFYVGSRTKTFSIVTRTLEIGKDVNFASGQKWASFYTTMEDLLLPEGVMAYIVTAVGNDVATVKAINYVPKNVPVLIEKESTTMTDNTSAEGNLLQGTAESTAVSGIEGNVYVLYNGGFTRTTTGAIPAKRAYLVLEQAAGARLSIVEGEATDITSVGYESVATDGSTYDMQGRKVESLSKKGLYIKNGRKVVIK